MFNRPPRKMFGQPYDEVMEAHRANVAALEQLRADRPGPPGPNGGPGLAALLTERPATWSYAEWGDYMDDTAEELRELREQDTDDEGETS
ncbi:hypothetical protein [Nocardia brasiliensis]|uniref:hypothetical protein n=1 Tax=Nocardia brasiliensis TaxID=37326 RepID=UPI0024585734|nr:hypothetical protein [Nocardia brasiliensis]